MTPRSLHTLEQLRSDVANLATALDSGELRLWVTALDEVLREVGGNPLSGGDDDRASDAMERLAAATPEGEGVSASGDTDGVTGFPLGDGTQATEGVGSEVGPGPAGGDA